jgi:hypothetical protein
MSAANEVCASDSEGIEVGVEEGGLRYWRAKEAMRQAELQLTAQAATKQAFETRAAALLSWIVAISSLMSAGGTFSTRIIPVMAMLGVLTVSALICISVVWPRFWSQPGYDPRLIMEDQHGTELEQLESLALGYANGIEGNEQRLDRDARRMRAAFCLLGLVPLTGAIALLLTLV